jgi:hypothetical protein
MPAERTPGAHAHPAGADKQFAIHPDMKTSHVASIDGTQRWVSSS